MRANILTWTNNSKANYVAVQLTSYADVFDVERSDFRWNRPASTCPSFTDQHADGCVNFVAAAAKFHFVEFVQQTRCSSVT